MELRKDEKNESEEIIAILDAGSQFGKVIDRRIRELKVKTEILPLSTPLKELLRKNVRGIIISGGPGSVYDNMLPYDEEIFRQKDNKIPVLGICYGAQMINHFFGGVVKKTDRREDGQMEISVSVDSALFKGLDEKQEVLLTHGDAITTLGEGLNVIAKSRNFIAGVEHKIQKLFGLQFHPEVDLTLHGKEIFSNFLFEIVGASGDFTLEDRESSSISYIKERVKDKKVLVLCSGGVDSTVCATLLIKAIGPERVIALHIDNGFMRKDESKQVKEALHGNYGNLFVVDASDRFYNATTQIKGVNTSILCQTANPEEKRKIIGDTFMRVTNEEIRKMNLNPDEMFIAQGTLRPDLIESASELASASATAIKTHHNDTELVRLLRKAGRVIEPLADYHKDEVRELGLKLGLSSDLVWRQPFPGPGLAVRILCAEKPFMDDSFAKTNKILKRILHRGAKEFEEQMNKEDVENDEIQRTREHLENVDLDGISATLLPVQTVGVQGDARTYQYIAALSGKMDWDALFTLAKAIPQVCHNVNRVVYVFGEMLTGSIEKITPTLCTPDVISTLQEADAIVNDSLKKNELIRKLSQVPVILFPVDFDNPENPVKRSIGIRPFITSDFMTGSAAVPEKDLPMKIISQMVEKISRIDGISRVAYDLTSKPPGTTEWE